MVEERKNYLILSDSVEGFKQIEEAYNHFKKNYTLKSQFVTKFLIGGSFGFGKYIQIYPANEQGKIEEVKTNDSNLEGRIIQSGSGEWVISLGDYKYLIEEINPDFKRNK